MWDRLKSYRTFVLTLGLLALLLSITSTRTLAQTGEDDGNLLVNPGFEDGFAKQCCMPDPGLEEKQIPIDEVQVGVGWHAWWVEPDGVTRIANCEEVTPTPGQDCVAWHRPEYRDAAPYTNRIRNGINAQKYFTFFSLHEAGLYQIVGGVTPGDRLQFNIYMHAWSTNGEAAVSSEQVGMNMQIGIDPLGGANPYAASVVWSPIVDYYDNWGLYSVEAVAQANTVTVFTRSRPVYALRHNDVYLDDAELIVIDGSGGSGQASTPRPPGGPTYTSGPSPTPSDTPTVTPEPTSPWATSTPLPNGEIWWVIKSGDTLRVLAFYNETTVEEIQALNGLTSNIVSAGQRILVKVVDTPTPEPTSTPTPQPTHTASATALPTEEGAEPTSPPPAIVVPYGEVCVIAYNDLNINASNDGEPRLAGVSITLSNNAGPLATRTSTDSTDPTCFSDLPTGDYSVRIQPPPGYLPTTIESAAVTVTESHAITVLFGLTEQPVAEGGNDGGDSGFATLIAGIIGATLVLFALIAGIVLFLNNRK